MEFFFKRVIVIFLLFIIAVLPVNAKDNIKLITHMDKRFYLSNIPSEVYFRTIKKITILNEITIPQRSIVTAEVIQAQKERRWHKSGYILCKIKSYTLEYTNETFDISDKNIYLVARKYEPVNKKEASILATEILLTQAASFFAPGVDILYFFTKGAILREKDPNWFKAGVSNAYDNSICWFWLKGKPINLNKDEKVQLKSIKEDKALKLKTQIEQRKAKQLIKDEKTKAKIMKKYLNDELASQIFEEKFHIYNETVKDLHTEINNQTKYDVDVYL